MKENRLKVVGVEEGISLETSGTNGEKVEKETVAVEPRFPKAGVKGIMELPKVVCGEYATTLSLYEGTGGFKLKIPEGYVVSAVPGETSINLKGEGRLTMYKIPCNELAGINWNDKNISQYLQKYKKQVYLSVDGFVHPVFISK